MSSVSRSGAANRSRPLCSTWRNTPSWLWKMWPSNSKNTSWRRSFPQLPQRTDHIFHTHLKQKSVLECPNSGSWLVVSHSMNLGQMESFVIDFQVKWLATLGLLVAACRRNWLLQLSLPLSQFFVDSLVVNFLEIFLQLIRVDCQLVTVVGGVFVG